MKKSLIAVAVLGAFTGAAQADDAVTLYGVIDAAVRNTSNASYNVANNTGSSYTGFSQGLFNGSRFGLRGSEALDNGMKAIYTLEAGVVLGTGASDQQGQLMGRQAWVGMSDDTYGSLTFGRQYGNFSGAIGTGDVFGELHGNEVYSGSAGMVNGATSPNQGDTASENGFAYGLSGYRWDNSILYANKFGPVKFSLMHSFQGQSSSANNQVSGQAETMNAFAIGYVSDDFSATAGWQKETDAGPNAAVATSSANPTHTDVGIGANFMYGDKTEFGGRNGVFGYYMRSKFDAGFTRVGLGTNSEFAYNATVVGTSASNILYSARQDKVLSLSTNYYATSRLNLIAAYFRDNATNVLDPTIQATQVAQAGGADGSRSGFILTADYYQSKNTDTYLMFANTTFKGALVNNPNGGNNMLNSGTSTSATANVGLGPTSVRTVMLGLRHRF